MKKCASHVQNMNQRAMEYQQLSNDVEEIDKRL